MTQGVTVDWFEELLEEFANKHPQLNIDSSAARLILAQCIFHKLSLQVAERGGDYT